MTQVIARLDMSVDSIKRSGPHAFEVRAFSPSEPGRKVGSIFFEIDDPINAPIIGEGLIITVEHQRVEATDEPFIALEGELYDGQGKRIPSEMVTNESG